MTPTLDRRRPRVTVTDLRRDLRDADRRAYALSTGPQWLQRASARSGTVPVLLAVTLTTGVASVAWAAHLVGTERVSSDVRVEIKTVPTPQPFQDDRGNAGDDAASMTPVIVAKPSTVEVPSPRPRPRAVTTTRTMPGARVAPSKPRRTFPPAPRPLSPGEFGRQSD
jgi:hypothetical protein